MYVEIYVKQLSFKTTNINNSIVFYLKLIPMTAGIIMYIFNTLGNCRTSFLFSKLVAMVMYFLLEPQYNKTNIWHIFKTFVGGLP